MSSTDQSTRLPARTLVVGAGSWGTAFAKVLADNVEETPRTEDGRERRVQLWGRDAAMLRGIAETGRNARYLPEIALPAALEPVEELEPAVREADLVVLAVPAQALRGQLVMMAPWLRPETALVSLAKGLERGTEMRMTEVVAQVLAEHTELDAEHWASRLCVVSGPNLAREIAEEQPTASVVASLNPQVAAEVAAACVTGYFRPYTNNDVVGVEIGGLVKNVIALCVGICDGLDYGDNSKASIITRGLAETTRLALALGGRLETMSGLAGLGDMVATCSSPLSRNQTAGRLLGQGLTLTQVQEEMTQTAEGIKTAPAVLDLARQHGVEMPITEAVVAVLEDRVAVVDMAPMLLGRKLRSEGTHR